MDIESSWNGYAWTAIYPNYYDGAPNAGRRARMVGSGNTKDEAIEDLQEQARDMDLCETCGGDVPCTEAHI